MLENKAKKWSPSKLSISTTIMFLVGLFIVIPFFLIFRISFSDIQLAMPPFREIIEWTPPYFLEIRLNFSNYITVLTDSYYIHALYTSVMIAIITTFSCLILGFGMAYGIYCSKKQYQPYLLLLIALPFWTSFLIRVYAWMGILSDSGLINQTLMALNIIANPLALMDNAFGTCIGLIYCYLPFMIFPLYSSLSKLNPSLLEASFDLGASPLRTFTSITVPLCKNGIITGMIFVFIPTVGEFVIPELMGGPELITIGRVLWNEFFYSRNWPLASAIAVVVVVIFVIPVFWWQNKEFQKDVKQPLEEEFTE